MNRIGFLVPAREIVIGRPKFGVSGSEDNKLFYMSGLGDALKRGVAYAGGIRGNIYTARVAWENYHGSLGKLLNVLELPEGFPEKLEEYVKNAEKGLTAKAEETGVTRGRGWLGGGFEGLISIELKAPNGSIKLRVHRDIFEKKPALQNMPPKSYRERRFWLT